MEEFSKQELAEENANLLGKVQALEERLNLLEVLLFGSVSSLADPNIPAPAAPKKNSMEARLACLERDRLRHSIKIDDPNYLQFCQDMVKALLDCPDFTASAKTTWEEVVADQSFQNILTFHLRSPINELATTAAQNALDAYILDEDFETALNNAIDKALIRLGLSELDQQRAKSVLLEYIKPKWNSLKEGLQLRFSKFLEESEASVPSSRPAATPLLKKAFAPQEKPSKRILEVAESDEEELPDSKLSKSELTAKLRRDVERQYKREKDVNNQARKSAVRVARFLELTSGVPHQPNGTRIKRIEPNDRFHFIEAEEILKLEPKCQEWEDQGGLQRPPPSTASSTYPSNQTAYPPAPAYPYPYPYPYPPPPPPRHS